MQYLKTIISRDKLYQRNYLSDKQEIIFMEDSISNNSIISSALIEILLNKYKEKIN
ncbi:hypothetical protein [Anaerovorax odorimutans]|uniref:hypothetical protein n=1 Tax=Anaerovorax odorimutans TaxID=109327 RepID=UPI000416B38B|nr:hypothetical protein [Anaerovorax odorimutans]